MSFLGSLGTLVSGSGLSHAMECCYGPNSVRHIFSGKAIARATRAHCLVESALTIMLLESVSTESFQGELAEIQEYYTGVIGGDGAAATSSDGGDDTYPAALHRVEESVQDLKRTLTLSPLHSPACDHCTLASPANFQRLFRVT